LLLPLYVAVAAFAETYRLEAEKFEQTGTGNRLDGAMLARTRAAGFLWKAFVEEEKGWTPDVVHPIALLLRLID
jgi:hypothetical protein